MIQIREMTQNDFDYALRLTDLMKWDYSLRDFEWMIYFEPKGCFIATDDDKRIGITTTITYENLGWIGNVIISPKYQRRDVGSKLVEHAIEYLESKSMDFIGLYSYPETSRFYRNFGFDEDEQFIEFVGKGSEHSNKECRMIAPEDLEYVLEFDIKCFGANRKKVLTRIFKNFNNFCWVTGSNKEIIGYIMGTGSATVAEIGPWICDPKYFEKGIGLLKAFLSNNKGIKINLGIIAKNIELANKLKELQFEIDFEILRMFYKGKKPEMRENFIFAIGSLERG